MKLTLHVNGLTFESAITGEVSVETAKGRLFDNLDELKKLEMKLSNGSFVIIGEGALKNSVLIFSEA